MKNPRISNDEVSLIKRAQAGDESAFNTLYNKYYKYVLSIVLHVVHDEDIAQDVAITVFVKAYENLSEFKDYSSFGGWLRTIAYRCAVDYLREVKREKEVPLEDVRLTSSCIFDGEFEIVDRITKNQVISEFKKLSKDHQRICELFYIKELTIQQISRKLRIPEGTIKSILSRVRKRLRKQFN